MTIPKHVSDLAANSIGWEISDVSVSDRKDCAWKLTLKRGQKTRTLHLGSYKMDAWVEGILDDDKTYSDFDSMLTDMGDHVGSVKERKEFAKKVWEGIIY